MKQIQCANYRTSGCDNFVTRRGNILCDDCRNERKEWSKNRHENEIDDFIQKNKHMEEQLEQFRLRLQEETSKFKSTISSLEQQISEYKEQIEKYKLDSVNQEQIDLYQTYNLQLQKENDRLTNTINELSILNEQLTQNIEKNEMIQQQLQLDNEQLKLELDK